MGAERGGNVVVTGGASGLGAAIVERLAAAGRFPVVLDLRPPGNGVAHAQVDLADGRQAEEAVGRVVREHGDLTGVVCAAGVDACGALDDVPPDYWERVIAVNLVGTAAVVRAALPSLERTGYDVTLKQFAGGHTVPSDLAREAFLWATAKRDSVKP